MKEEKVNRILQLIKNDKPQEDHLFKTLAVTDNPFPLLVPLKEKGYFNPDRNPAPKEVPDQEGFFTIPHWNILGYLENIFTYNSKNPSKEITETLKEIIAEIIDFRTETGNRIENYRTDWVIAKIIFKLPIEEITEKHIEFVYIALNTKWNSTLISSELAKSILPTLIKQNAKELLLKLIEVLFRYKINEGKYSDKYDSIVKSYWLKNALKNHKGSIAALCGLEAADIAIRKISEIIEQDNSQFNNIWIPTIEDHPQTIFPDRYECLLIHFVRDMFELSVPDKIKERIQSLLAKEHPIFKRLALHAINFLYTDLSELFWNWKDNPLNERLIKHELYELLKNNQSTFNKTQISTLLKWIEEKDYYISNDIKEEKKLVEKLLAYRKKEWLSAIMGTKEKEVLKLYNNYNSINPAELDHPGFDSWGETGWGAVSPVEESGLLTKTNSEIVIYLNSFREERGWKKPTIDGLSGTLRKCVSDAPDKFTDDIKPFLGVQLVYQHALLWGFSEAWRSKKDIEWKSLLVFISEIINSDTFWIGNDSDQGNHHRDWIISQISDLINDGTKNHNHVFDAELLPEAEKTLLLLAEKTEADSHEMHDIVTSVLNSVKGKIFTAMVNYSLRYARLYCKDKEQRWIDTIKNDFTNRLDKKLESSFDFSVVLGEYLPTLYYLDKEWVITNINKIFLKDKDVYWRAAFTGYLFYSSNVYSHLYDLLAQNSHYEKALITDFEDDHITERVAQHICVGYLEDWEKLDDRDSLIAQLINSDNLKHLSAIISFFWIQRDSITEKVKNKIKPLWRELYSNLVKHENEKEYQILISDIAKWLALLDEIDSNAFEWLKLSAKYIESNFNSPFFIEYFLKHVEKTPDKVGNLFLEMLSCKIYPEYNEEHIVELITKLDSHGQTEKAITICNKYMENGFVFTRPLLEKISEQK